MKPLVIIPVRGGSKGVPRKNIKLLGGKPLIQYTIEAAREIFSDEVICVSTDDLEIKEVAERLGLDVPFMRPAELASDQAGSCEVLLHAIDFYEKSGYFPDTIILLQATSPFRTGKHIKEALKLFDDSCEMVVSMKVTKANPYSVLRELNSEGWLEKSKPRNFSRRQDVPKVWELNGAIYLIRVDSIKLFGINNIKRVRGYEMEEIVSHDIDTTLDWIVAEAILKINLI
jgi:CMP-N,N'-diacetyllegionaminic acid synthase